MVTFWDTSSNQCYVKNAEKFQAIASNADHCVIAVETKISAKEFSGSLMADKSNEFMYQLLVCNSISTTVDCEYER